MKNLILGLALSATCVASAVTCQWGSGDLYFNGKGSQVGDNAGTALDKEVTGYLFTGLTLADYNKLTTAEIIWSSFSGGELKVSGGGTYTGEGVQSKWGVVAWSETDGTDGTPEYAAVILTYNDGDEDFYSANTVTGTPGQKGLSIDTAALGWGEMAGGKATTWEAAAVPEPFSGSLALLGVGLVALRRKMKKQKKA